MLQPTATIELIWQDETGSRATVTAHGLSSLTVAELEAGALALASVVSPLTDCTLVGSRIRYKSAYEAGITADGPNLMSHTGALFFSQDGGEVAGPVFIPGIKDSAFITLGPGAGFIIDLANPDVSALISAVLDAGICNPFAVPFVDILAGYLQSRV